MISFHSLEDRIVKRFIRREEQGDPVYAGLPDIPPHARPRLRRVGRAIDAERRGSRTKSARAQCGAAHRREGRSMSALTWRLSIVLLGLALLGSSLGVVYSKQEARNRFNDLQRLTRERDELDIEWGQLQLEQSTWATNGRVESVARDDLHMVIPQATDLRIVRP